MPKKIRTRPAFDKYFYYTNSVQSAEHDAKLIKKMAVKSAGSKALPDRLLLQEDFCGTAALCYEWAKLGPQFEAVGIDFDNAALEWGKRHHARAVSNAVSARVTTICEDVLSPHHLRPHVICALNFSYFFMEERKLLLHYFKTAHASLEAGGIVVLDAFGGPEYLQPHSDKRRNAEEKFNYWWNVESFDALTHRMTCRLDYQRDGEAIRKNVFSYKWRLWGVPEITDILKESGFVDVHYWAEGTDVDGTGDGRYRPVKSESDCEAWVCYIVAKK